MQAVGYCRVSTTGQADLGVSLAAQEAKIRAWAQLHDHQLVKVYVDAGIGGARMDTRPALQEALRHACKARGPLVVYSLSRLARSTLDAISISERLARAGADLISLTERIDTTSASGRLFFRLLSSLGEFERDLVGERTKAALEHLARQGRRTSRFPPYGYDFAPDGQTLVPNPEELQVVTWIRDQRDQGASYWVIATRLREAGTRSKLGGQWTAKGVRAIVKRHPIAA
jgi:DNA invertase Pin-like site-specific DNA recombinase